jgi:8-oxo-dGTP diphosphatase
MKLVLVTACALIDRDHRILLAQRPPGKSMAGLWEFPGGKCEPGETPEFSLIRELREELDISVPVQNLMPLCFASHTYGPEFGDFHLLMPLYVCTEWQGACRALEGQNLNWVAPSFLRDYPMPGADEPLIGPLQKFCENLIKY